MSTSSASRNRNDLREVPVVREVHRLAEVGDQGERRCSRPRTRQPSWTTMAAVDPFAVGLRGERDAQPHGDALTRRAASRRGRSSVGPEASRRRSQPPGTGADRPSEPARWASAGRVRRRRATGSRSPPRALPLADGANGPEEAGHPRPVLVADWEIDLDVCRRSADQAAQEGREILGHLAEILVVVVHARNVPPGSDALR
jgi:hypothetical protein